MVPSSCRRTGHPPRPGLAGLLLAACLAGSPAAPTLAQEAAPRATACPARLPAQTRCLTGQDSAGAEYLIALPVPWSGVLILHAHGGPSLGRPEIEPVRDDLQRWAVMVRAGHAWAGSSYRQGGVEVRAAAEDTERLRRLFEAHVAVARRTLLHGQSWGASVAARAAERHAYDGVLLTSGVVGGGSRAYDFRFDLRVVYQYLCGNHPSAEEESYPLWMGLPPQSRLTRGMLAARVDECLGLRRPATQRSPEQQRRVSTLVNVIRIPESALLSHLSWATWHFRDIVQERTGGLNPFGNEAVRYQGSDDDEALNAGVQRYRADPRAVARFAQDADPTGEIRVPVLTVHGIHDPTAFVEQESAFRSTMERAGTATHLVQTYTNDARHHYLADPVYPTLVDALLRWIEHGQAPTPAGIARSCKRHEARFGPGCRFLPHYRPRPLETRIAPRHPS